MAESLNTSEARRRFGELLDRVSEGRERFLIRRRGRPVAAIVSARDLERLRVEGAEAGGLLSVAGLLADFPEWHEAMDAIVATRGG